MIDAQYQHRAILNDQIKQNIPFAEGFGSVPPTVATLVGEYLQLPRAEKHNRGFIQQHIYHHIMYIQCTTCVIVSWRF
jgi:hypothetical protein